MPWSYYYYYYYYYIVLCAGVLLRDANFLERALQRDVPGGCVLPLQDISGGARIRHLAPHLHLHHVLHGGPQPQHIEVSPR